MDPDTRLADDHGSGNVRSPGNSLIPTGWHLIKSGPLCAGDKTWSAEKLAWLPVTTNSFYMAENFPAAIRKKA